MRQIDERRRKHRTAFSGVLPQSKRKTKIKKALKLKAFKAFLFMIRWGLEPQAL